MKSVSVFRVRSANSQRGVSLIEVLVAILILAIGGLGAAMFQLNAVKFNRTALIRSQATILAYQIVDSMRANKANALAGAYNVSFNFLSPSCTTVASCDLRAWNIALQQNLPAGTGQITFNGNTATISVQWDESRLANLSQSVYSTPASSQTQAFQFQTQL